MSKGHSEPTRGVEAWRCGEGFQEFFERGVLDVALFDVGDSCDEIVLQRSSETVSAGDLSRPLVVLANYVFDSVPQDLYYLCEGASQECRVSVACDRDPRTLELSSDLFSHIRYRYSHHASGDSKPAAGDLRRLLEGYERSLSTPTCSFPALRCAVCRA